MALHSFKIPIHPLALDSTVLDSSSEHARNFTARAGQSGSLESANPGKPSAILERVFPPQKYFKTRDVIGRQKRLNPKPEREQDGENTHAAVRPGLSFALSPTNGLLRVESCP